MKDWIPPLVLLGIAVICIGVVIYFIRKKKEGIWQVGNHLWCDAAGDPGVFYIAEAKQIDGVNTYHIMEGPAPGIDDLGWWSESQLISAPWSCSLHTV